MRQQTRFCAIGTLHQRYVLWLFIIAITSLFTGTSTLYAGTFSDKPNSKDKLYEKTLKQLRNKQLADAHNNMRKLEDYALYPYLVRAELYQRLDKYPSKDVESFLNQYDNTVVNKQLRKRWLLKLAHAKRWDSFLKHYNHRQASLELQCLHLKALHATKRSSQAYKLTHKIWLNGESLPDACDSSLTKWKKAGHKTPKRDWQRILLATNADNHGLAKYISQSSSKHVKKAITLLKAVDENPAALKVLSFKGVHKYYYGDILHHGLRRLAYKDPELATQLWQQYHQQQLLSSAQSDNIRQRIATQMIASGDPHTLDWLLKYDPNAKNSFLTQWRVRAALGKENWQQVNQWIPLLSNELQQQSVWRYWKAFSQLKADSHNVAALESLQQLAQERHYYGFLAAQYLNQPFQLNHTPTQFNKSSFDSFVNKPAIQRALAFYRQNKLRHAHSEWYSAMRNATQNDFRHATYLAQKLGWHHQAIRSISRAKSHNDIDIRFPLAFTKQAKKASKSSNLDMDMIYAITRQESAFAPNARSRAGARGLMQLMPGTAKLVAKQQGIKIKQKDLYSAEVNMKLGSHYLKDLLDKYQGNRILAAAAYNAGPNRINRWLEKQAVADDPAIWIETLPYYETRDYIKNVLAYSLIYSQKLGKKRQLLEPNEFIINQLFEEKPPS